MRAKYAKKKILPLMSPARQRQKAVAAAIMPNVADAGRDQHMLRRSDRRGASGSNEYAGLKRSPGKRREEDEANCGCRHRSLEKATHPSARRV